VDVPTITYELQMDDGYSGPYKTVHGGDQDYRLELYSIITDGIYPNRQYRFRYRGKNVAGYSGWSPVTYLSASDIPSTPLIPTLDAETDVIVHFPGSLDTGGVDSVTYELEINDSPESTFNGVSINLTDSALSLVTGNIYSLKYRANNVNGYSLWSEVLNVGLGSYPSKPTGLVRHTSGNSETSIGLIWTAITTDDLPVLEYIIYVGDSRGENSAEVSRVRFNTAIVSNLDPGVSYTIQVSAVNFNGEGTLKSDPVVLISCIPPYGVNPPIISDVTSTSVKLTWSSPDSNGGCPIEAYALYRNSGSGSAISVPVDSATLASKPMPFYDHITSISGLKGEEIRFKLEASNSRDATQSEGFTSVVLADVPPQPDQIQQIISTSQITDGQQFLNFKIPEVADDGGADIEAPFHVEVSIGWNGNFELLPSTSTDSLQRYWSIPILPSNGIIYRVRYKIQNERGWSDFSEITDLGVPPSGVGIPEYTSSTQTQLVITFKAAEMKGSENTITYTIEYDKGDNTISTDSYTEATLSKTFVIDDTDPTKLQPGIVYFKSYATNTYGNSEMSPTLRIGAGRLPEQPSAPKLVEVITHEDIEDMPTTIAISWNTMPDHELPITGWYLYRTNASNEFEVIYDGSHRPGKLEFIDSQSIVLGQSYQYKVSALNINGEGDISDPVLIYA
jgi:hypothetical protein